jgi:pimeloyl-ACP methyl ester carboxylesterase
MTGDGPGDDLFYIDYFQTPGLVESEVEKDLEGWLRGFYFTASGEADLSAPAMGIVPRGHELRERFQQPGPGQMGWMTDDDFAFYLGEFERTGLTGGFNRYRNIERDWTELAPWRHAPITVPSLFVGGDRDGPTRWGQAAIDRFDRTLPRLTRSEILEGCGHWTQQERPEAVNQLLLEFVAGLG